LAFSGRIKIAHKAAWLDINIAPQLLISWEMNDDGSYGGKAFNEFEWMAKNEITEEACSTHTTYGHSYGQISGAIYALRACNSGEVYFLPDQNSVYSIDGFGHVYSEENMMQVIESSGPIGCGIAVLDSLLDRQALLRNHL